MSALEKAKKVAQERNTRVFAAQQGAGSALDRKRQNIINSERQKLADLNSGKTRLTQGEYDRAVAITRGFLDPVSGTPTGKTLSSSPIIPTKQPDRSLVSPLLKNSQSSLTKTQKFFENNPQLVNTSGATFERGLSPNIAVSTPSIRRPDGTIININSSDLSLEEIEALQIIGGQQAFTQSLAEQISARRRAALLAGATRDQAQKFAVSGDSSILGINIAPPQPAFINDKGEFGFSTDLRNRVNTELQAKQVRRNSARLEAAEIAIKNQVTSGKAGDLDNLKQILINAPNQNKPVSRILASTDEKGKVVSPRNIKLQTENAALTGIDPNNFRVDLSTSGGQIGRENALKPENIAELNEIIRSQLEKTLGPLGFTDVITTRQGIDGELTVDFASGVPEQIQELAADQVSSDVSSFFGGVGSESQNKIKESILNGEILDFGKLIPNFPEISSNGLSSGGGSGFLDNANNTSLIPFILIGGIAVVIFIVIKARKK